MASIEYINKRIEGKQKEITKLENKLSRIENAKASNWENNPYYYREDDLRWTLKDLEAARVALDKYKAQLVTETEKANSRNVPAILEYLEKWKTRVAEHYRKGLVEYYEMQEKVRTLYQVYNETWYGTPEREKAEAEYKKAADERWCKLNGYYHEEEYEQFGRKWKKKVKDADGELEYIRPYNDERDIDAAMAKLTKDLKREAEIKYDDIIERTNAICGTITDATGLYVGAKGELDGIVIGERGNAKVQTIGAGGYNIQCFHFRTLVHEIK